MLIENYPLISAATVLTGVTLLISLLVSFGVPITAEQKDIILQIVAFAAPWLVVWWGHRKTTPLAKPTDETGQPLVRKSDGLPTLAQSRNMR